MALLMRRDTVVIQAAPPVGDEAPAGEDEAVAGGGGGGGGGGSQPGGAEETTGPDTIWAVLGFSFVGIGALISWWVFESQEPDVLDPPAGISVFAPMYVIAQAIERFMEPFTSMLGTTKADDGETTNKGDAKAKVEAAVAEGDLDEAAKWQAILERIRRNRTVIAWGIASFIAMVLSGWFGFRLLNMTGLDAPGAIDVIITGLAIGSGTKPLHDLISNMQKAKDQKTDPPETATTD